ncbi:cyclic lactone autoinducer peptide [Desulforamulus aquiferis]|uniref:Cyclic lactone autoinducer peptide n=1 Tax=Desulforamulus aquiferis TaxID=1397668 RepID=A0AAW7ZHE4_9FIRM|nr:cyclic lactone autoinducer peptide [Desulforamulus aquiferis]MDO7788851.1 cyclic lactone autoinducer peptide [Desulforamulus aquiferis]
MKTLRTIMASGLLSVMVLFAQIGVGPTCWLAIYQPEVPQCLRK